MGRWGEGVDISDFATIHQVVIQAMDRQRNLQQSTTLPYMAEWYEIPAPMLEFADAIIYDLVLYAFNINTT